MMDFTPTPEFLETCRRVLDTDATLPATTIPALRSPELPDEIQRVPAELPQPQQPGQPKPHRNRQSQRLAICEEIRAMNFMGLTHVYSDGERLADEMLDLLIEHLRRDPFFAHFTFDEMELRLADWRARLGQRLGEFVSGLADSNLIAEAIVDEILEACEEDAS